MEVEEINKLAAASAELPEGTTLSEQLLYLTLRELYSNYRSGAVNRERAKREKQRILVAFDKMKGQFKVMDYHLTLRKRLEYQVGELHKCNCPTCRQFISVLDGIARRDIPDDAAEVHAWNEKLRDLVKERSERAGQLRTLLDRVGWALDEDATPEAKLEKIKEVIKQV